MLLPGGATLTGQKSPLKPTRQMHRHVHSAALQRNGFAFPRRLPRQTGQNTPRRHLNRQTRFALVSGNHRLLPAHGSRHIHRPVVGNFLWLPKHAPGTAAQVRAAGRESVTDSNAAASFCAGSASSSQCDGTLTASRLALFAPLASARSATCAMPSSAPAITICVSAFRLAI